MLRSSALAVALTFGLAGRLLAIEEPARHAHSVQPAASAVPGAASVAASSNSATTAHAAERAAPDAAQQTADFRVVFWYHGGQLKSRAYDLRKGQYTKAVDDWVNRVHYDSSGYFVLPGPMATVRDVSLEKEPGATETEKLSGAIARLKLAIEGANRNSLATAGYLHSLRVFDDRTGLRDAPTAHAAYRYIPEPLPFAPGSGGLFAPYGPAPYPFPNPYPYVRPHP